MSKIKIDKDLILEYTSLSTDPNAYNYIPPSNPVFKQSEIDSLHMLSPFEKQSLTNANIDQIQKDPIKQRAFDKVKQFYQNDGKKALEFAVTQHKQLIQ